MEVSYFKELYKSKGRVKNIVEVVDEIKFGTHKKLIRSIKDDLEDGTLSDSERSSLIQKKKQNENWFGQLGTRALQRTGFTLW